MWFPGRFWVDGEHHEAIGPLHPRPRVAERSGAGGLRLVEQQRRIDRDPGIAGRSSRRSGQRGTGGWKKKPAAEEAEEGAIAAEEEAGPAEEEAEPAEEEAEAAEEGAELESKGDIVPNEGELEEPEAGQKPGGEESQEVEEGGAQALAAGKSEFETNCSSCHTLADAGATGEIGPNLDQLKPEIAVVETQVINGGGAMPAFQGTLSEEEIAAVAAYVSTVAGTEG